MTDRPLTPKEELAEYVEKMNKLEQNAWLAEATAIHDKVIGRFFKHNPPNHTWVLLAYQYRDTSTVHLEECAVCKEKRFTETYVGGGGA